MVGDATLLPTQNPHEQASPRASQRDDRLWSRWAKPKKEVDLVAAVENMRRQSLNCLTAYKGFPFGKARRQLVTTMTARRAELTTKPRPSDQRGERNMFGTIGKSKGLLVTHDLE